MSDTNETARAEPSHDPRRPRVNTLHLHRIYNPADLTRAIEELSGGVGEGNFDDGA